MDTPVWHAVVDLDVPLIISASALSTDLTISLGPYPSRLHWPTWDLQDGEQRSADPPVGFEAVADGWGEFTANLSGVPQVAVPQVAFSVDLPGAALAMPPEKLGSGFAKGTGPLRDLALEWTTRFRVLSSLLLRQPLDPMDPSPLTVNQLLPVERG